MACAGLVAFQWAAAAVADFSTDARIGIAGVGFANRRWSHADMVDAFPAGLRAGAAFEGTATAIADASTVLAAFVLARHLRAIRRGHADSRAEALPAGGTTATFQRPAAPVANDPAVQGSLSFAGPIGLTDAGRIGRRIHAVTADGVQTQRTVGAAVRREDRVASISDPARIAEGAGLRIFAGRRMDTHG